MTPYHLGHSIWASECVSAVSAGTSLATYAKQGQIAWPTMEDHEWWIHLDVWSMTRANTTSAIRMRVLNMMVKGSQHNMPPLKVIGSAPDKEYNRGRVKERTSCEVRAAADADTTSRDPTQPTEHVTYVSKDMEFCTGKMNSKSGCYRVLSLLCPDRDSSLRNRQQPQKVIASKAIKCIALIALRTRFHIQCHCACPLNPKKRTLYFICSNVAGEYVRVFSFSRTMQNR